MSRIPAAHDVGLMMLAIPNHREIMVIVDQLQRRGFRGVVAALAEYPDRAAELEAAGVRAFSFHAEAGVGFADHASALAALASAGDQGSTTSKDEMP